MDYKYAICNPWQRIDDMKYEISRLLVWVSKEQWYMLGDLTDHELLSVLTETIKCNQIYNINTN